MRVKWRVRKIKKSRSLELEVNKSLYDFQIEWHSNLILPGLCFLIPEGPEIRRAADRIRKVLVGKEIIESNFYYERIREKHT